MERLKNKDKVLEVGGWAQPFNRADVVVDIQPYETRSFLGNQGSKKENFNKENWYVIDACSREGLPFKDKSFDFVICSHILEDLRDPIKVCAELIRVGKRGYIEIPSMASELTKGLANKKYCGYYHHRWLVEIRNDKVIFRFKPHFIHNDWRFHLPKKYKKRMNKEEEVDYLFWDNDFDYCEVIQISRDKIEKYIYDFVKNKKVYPKIKYVINNINLGIKDAFTRLRKRLKPSSYYHRYMDTPVFIGK
ncbi:class I SAM-dependent methyltransferase [Nanoarchaeota archaeon]